MNAAALDQWNGGSAPVAECRTEGAVRQGNRPPGTSPEGTLPGPVRSQGRVARCVIQNWFVSYVGYSLKEPWGEPRVVIGIDADEAEYLAEFLDRDECAQRGQQGPPPQAQLPQVQLPQVPIRQMPIQQVPLQSGPLQSGPLQQVKLTEAAPEGTGEYPSSALLGAPVPFGRGRQSADQARDLAGWTSGELPGQVNEQLASWPPSADQPPASA